MGRPGGLPPSRGSSRIRASRASPCVHAVRFPAASKPVISPSGTASRASPARSRCRSAAPAAPARSAAQSRTAPVRASPASDRRSATRVAALRPRRPGQHAGRVDDRVGQAQVRGGHRRPSAWSRVSTPPGAGRPPRPAGGRQQPGGDLPVPGRGGQRRARSPVAAKRSRTASQGSGVRSRCQTRWPRPRRRGHRPSGRSARPATARRPLQQCLADGERRHARHDPHRYAVVAGTPAGPGHSGASVRRARRRCSLVPRLVSGVRRTGSVARVAIPSLLHPPFDDHLVVGVGVEKRGQRSEHVAGWTALGPGARPPGPRQRPRRHVDGYVIRAAGLRGSATA